MTSLLWLWTLGTWRWRSQLRTEKNIFTSTSADHWWIREVSAHAPVSVQHTAMLWHLFSEHYCIFCKLDEVDPPLILPQAHGRVPPVQRPVWRMEMNMWVWGRWSLVLHGTEVSWSCSTPAARLVRTESARGPVSSASSVTKTKWWEIRCAVVTQQAPPMLVSTAHFRNLQFQSLFYLIVWLERISKLKQLELSGGI